MLRLNRTPAGLLALTSGLFLSAAALAQDGAAAAPPPAASAAPASGPQMIAVPTSLLNLQHELNGLNSMDASISSLIHNTQTRLKAMDAFLQQKNLTADFATASATAKPMTPTCTFTSALNSALEGERLQGVCTVSTTDSDLLTKEVAATTAMTHENWDRLNALMSQVGSRTDFMRAKGIFEAYQEWAPGFNQAQVSAKSAREEQLRQQAAQHEKDQDAAVQAKLNSLQAQWDKIAYSCSGIDYNYTFSQSDAQPGPFSQSPTSGGPGFLSYSHTAGSGAVAGGQPAYTAPTTGMVMVPGLYDGPAGGQNIVGAPNMGYWGGSYWNTYADPYYDVVGYPHGVDAGYGRDGIHNGFNRSSGATPRPAVSGAGGVGGRGSGR